MLNIPEYYVQLKTMPEDPENSTAYGIRTQQSEIFMIMFPVPQEKAMPYDHPNEVIDWIHEVLEDGQGLIEVDSGMTESGKRFIYSIIKTLKEPSGVRYSLLMNVEFPEYTLNLQGLFDETGMTGIRDTTIMSVLMNQGKMDHTMEGWMEDPYDPEYKKGIQMNLSEKKEFDGMFPEHPLSMAREFIHFVKENN